MRKHKDLEISECTDREMYEPGSAGGEVWVMSWAGRRRDFILILCLYVEAVDSNGQDVLANNHGGEQIIVNNIKTSHLITTPDLPLS
jgi:hypothetical protein